MKSQQQKRNYHNSTFEIKKSHKKLKQRPMKHPFGPKTVALFGGALCWACVVEEKGACTPDCGHHIFGRVSNSPFNYAPMNYWDCHVRHDGKDGGHARHTMYERRQQYLRLTILWLASRRYRMTNKDKLFLEKYASSENLALIDEKF